MMKPVKISEIWNDLTNSFKYDIQYEGDTVTLVSAAEFKQYLKRYYDFNFLTITTTPLQELLEYWQEFYADSVLVHDFHAMQDELKELQASKVTNADMYQQVQDKWSENIYNAFHKFLNEDQWKKYLKGGAARDKKARDKRAEKALKAAAELKNGGK